jgi:hypothetical protein
MGEAVPGPFGSLRGGAACDEWSAENDPWMFDRCRDYGGIFRFPRKSLMKEVAVGAQKPSSFFGDMTCSRP